MKQSTNLKPIESNVMDFTSHEIIIFVVSLLFINSILKLIRKINTSLGIEKLISDFLNFGNNSNFIEHVFFFSDVNICFKFKI